MHVYCICVDFNYCMYTCIDRHEYVYVCIYVCMCVYVYMYMYTGNPPAPAPPFQFYQCYLNLDSAPVCMGYRTRG